MVRYSGGSGQAQTLSGGGGWGCPITISSSYLLVLTRGQVLARVVALGCNIWPRNISAEVTAAAVPSMIGLHDRADPCRMFAVGGWQVPSESVTQVDLHCLVVGSQCARSEEPTAASRWPAQLRVQPG